MPKDIIYIDGQIISASDGKISPLDKGLLFGWGVFETLRIYDGIPFMLDAHLKRMVTSAKRLNISMAIDLSTLGIQVAHFIREAEIKNGVLRITLTKGADDQSTIIFTHRPVLYKEKDYEQGFNAIISNIKRNETSPISYIKSLNYMDNMLAKEEAVNIGVNEALLLNGAGKLCEGSMTNLFYIKAGCLYTPSIACGLLPGIVRQLVIEKIAPMLEIEIAEGDYEPGQLFEADEAFLTNSVIQIMPLVSVNSISIGYGMAGKITHMIMDIYKKLVNTSWNG